MTTKTTTASMASAPSHGAAEAYRQLARELISRGGAA